MKKIKKLNFTYLSIIILLGSIFFISFFNFVDFIGEKTSNILIYTIFFILIILNNLKISLKSKNKGITTGIKIASIISISIILLKLIFKIEFNLYTLIYIILIYSFSIIPSIYGASKKSSNV